MRGLLASLLLFGIGACRSDGLGLPTASCGALTDAVSCKAANCQVDECPDCNGGVTFAGCYDQNTLVIDCSWVCSHQTCGSYTDPATCAADANCQVGGCGGSDFECVNKGSEPLECPINPQDCADITDEATCSATTQCHPVFDEPLCACDGVGCCAHFDHCAEGPVHCASDALPACPPPPSCDGTEYVIGYDGGCAEGCVLASACNL
jgi:hypothetical protein